MDKELFERPFRTALQVVGAVIHENDLPGGPPCEPHEPPPEPWRRLGPQPADGPHVLHTNDSLELTVQAQALGVP